jgi:four helix bundle protein
MGYKSFEELDCWKACREVQRAIKLIIKKLPVEEKYDLADNMKRAARSSSRNIAEGFGRYSYQENIKFCIISRGSLFELMDDLITCDEELYITKEEYQNTRKLIDKAAALLNGYINYLNKAKSDLSRVTESTEPYLLSDNG